MAGTLPARSSGGCDPTVDFEHVLTDELKEIQLSRRHRHTRRAVVLDGGARVAANKSQLFGLALSGGGVRSASFNLGVLRTLARLRLLREVDYLSTVSGGGYIGGWLLGWIWRQTRADEDARACPDPKKPAETERRRQRLDEVYEKLAGGRSPEAEFLREFSNYLTPRRGLGSVDSWTAAATYVRNLLLHQLVLILALSAALLAPHALLGLSLGAAAIAGVTVAFGAALAGDLLDRGLSLPGERRGRWAVSGVLAGTFALSAGSAALGDRRLWLLVAAGALYLLPIVWGSTAPLIRRVEVPFSGLVAATLGIVVLLRLGELLETWQRAGDRAAVLIWGPALVLGVMLGTGFLQVGMAGPALTAEAREWWSRLGAAAGRWVLVYTAVVAVALRGPALAEWLAAQAGGWVKWVVASGWLATTVTGLVGGKSGRETDGRWGAARNLVIRIAPYVFVAGLFVLLTWAVSVSLQWLESWIESGGPAFRIPPPVMGLLVVSVAALVLSWRVGVNRFSMHAFYRDRLVRCYLGASNEHREPDHFTGFDPLDDAICMADLSASMKGFPGPYPLINTTLNLVAGERLAWQERKGASFVITPLYSGSSPGEDAGAAGHGGGRLFANGFQRSDELASGLSLGTAMAVSGAALSPNMGYHSSPAVTFLMTVFNVRLGWWLGNPRHPATWQQAEPPIGLFCLLGELFGRTSDRSRYVYLSDGGHFENLGIYELVKRRCRFIVACDAEQDRQLTFGGLADAVKKCRSDLGIEIDIDVDPIRRDAAGRSSWHCAVGRIYYGRTDGEDAVNGTLVYLKASLTGDEPQDVANYAARNADFPQQTTADQWFDESQFESYRKLGEHVAASVFDPVGPLGPPGSSLEEYFVGLQRRWYPPSTARPRGEHAAALDAIVESIRTSPELRFLDGQVFPVVGTIARAHGMRLQPQWYLPRSPEEFRAGFYACQRVLNLMHSVYHDLALEREHDHPDNRGWMNLFRLWWWSRMFKFTWAVCASTYGARFQTFCERRLGFTSGTVELSASAAVPRDAARVLFWKGLEKSHGLNFYESRLARQVVLNRRKRFEGRAERPLHAVTALKLHLSEHPLKDEGGRKGDDAGKGVGVNFGCVVEERRAAEVPGDAPVGSDRERTGLVYLRIRSNLRGMGLARKGLEQLLHRQPDLELWLEDDQFAGLPERVTHAEVTQIRQLLESVRLEVQEKGERASEGH